MAEITSSAIYNEIQQNLLSEVMNQLSDITETSLLSAGTTNSTVDSSTIDEPPVKKSKITTNEKSRLLEDRIGSILSCCICLDLSTLPIYQVNIASKSFEFERHFLSLSLSLSLSVVCKWSFNVCLMFQSSTS